MATTAASEPATLYRKLMRRNRLISWLRIGVPLIGIAVLVMLLVQIIIANLVRDVGLAGVRIARDRLVLDAPQYAGVMANGTRYEINATAANTLIGDLETIFLDDAVLDLTRPDGATMNLSAKEAAFSLSKQIVDVEDVLQVIDSRGMEARLSNATIDWQTQKFVARDNVHIIFSDGSILTSSRLDYDAGAMVWAFRNVKLTLQSE